MIALVVENPELLATAGLPFAREIGLASGVARPLSAAGLESRMSDRAARLHRRVEQLAQRNAIEAELQVGRGRQAETALAQTRAGDLLVLCRTHWAQRPGDALEGVMAEAVCTVMLVGPRDRGAVHGPMVLLDGSEGALRALRRALVLVRDESRPLSLVVAPGADMKVRQRARALLAGRGIEARVIDLLQLDSTALLRAIRREQPWLLFVSRESPLFQGAGGRRLRIELDEVPLVIVP